MVLIWRKHNPNKSTDDLHIGAGKDLDVISFFSGLIDEIRIYDVALTSEQIAALSYL
ncbi:MAG: hypothetical protein HQ580_07500 [Planctomycetes bacterium]|nr:hypothetical protein [Planctomycetota bacterium]